MLYPKVTIKQGSGTLDNFAVTAAGTWSPTPLVSDSFDGRTTLATTDGAAAEEAGGSGLAWEALLGESILTVSSDRLTTNGSGQAIAAVDAGAAAVLIQATIQTAGANGTGLALRVYDSENYWRLVIESGGDLLNLYEVQAGTATSRASASVTINTATDYDFLAVTDGNTITGYLEAANRIQYAAAVGNADQTRHGVRFFNWGDECNDFVIWPRNPSGVPDCRPAAYQFVDRFDTDDAAPVTSPRRAEGGPDGELTATQSDNSHAIATGWYTLPAKNSAWGDAFHYSPVIARQAGTVLAFDFKRPGVTGEQMMVGFDDSGPPTTAFENAWYSSGSALHVRLHNTNILTVGYANGTGPHYAALVLRLAGAFFLFRDGFASAWTLGWVDTSGTTSKVYAGAIATDAASDCEYTFDNVRVTWPGTWSPTPLVSDSFGRGTIAGPERVIDGSFEQWTGGSPDHFYEVPNGNSGSPILEDTTTFVSGGSSLKLVETDALAAPGVYAKAGAGDLEDLVLEPGATYQLAIWTRGDGSDDGSINILSHNGTSWSDLGTFVTGISGTTWQQFPLRFTVPTDSVKVRIYLYGSPADDVAVWFDDLSIRKVIGGDTALATTDGLAAEETGGAGLSWTQHGGSWSITVDNTAKVGTITVFSSLVVDPQQADLVIQARLKSSTSAHGVALRLADTSNHWAVYHSSTNQVIIGEITAGGLTSRAAVALAYAANTYEDFLVVADGATITGWVDGANRVTYASATANQTSSPAGIWAAASNAVTCEELVIWPRYPAFPLDV